MGLEDQLHQIIIHSWPVMKSLSSSVLIRKYGSLNELMNGVGEWREGWDGGRERAKEGWVIWDDCRERDPDPLQVVHSAASHYGA